MNDFSIFDEIQDMPGEIFDFDRFDFDDRFDADQIDRRRAERDGWISDTQGRW